MRRTYKDAGDNPENPHDWTNFDIGKVVRLFRTSREGAIRLSLRKLHTRWWHASEHTMRRFLERVGVNERVLEMIPEIVQTCKVCRAWQKPGPSNACNSELADKFNEQVECDLLFVNKSIIFHMLDRCTRWHAAQVVPAKAGANLVNSLDETWLRVHGPMRVLNMDREGGIYASRQAHDLLHARGITYAPRAPDHQVSHIDRHL